MNTIDPHAWIVMLLCMGVAYVMAFAGVSKSALEWKRRRRVCPSCGRLDRSCNCTI